MAAAELAAVNLSEIKIHQLRDLEMSLAAIHLEMNLMTETPIQKRQVHARKFHDRVAAVLGV